LLVNFSQAEELGFLLPDIDQPRQITTRSLASKVFGKQNRAMNYQEVVAIMLREYPEHVEVPASRTDDRWLIVAGQGLAKVSVKQAVYEARTEWKKANGLTETDGD
jgi:hypothetical protein